LQLWLCGDEIGEEQDPKELDEKISHLFTEGVAVNSNAYLSKKGAKKENEEGKGTEKGKGKENNKDEKKKSKEQKEMEKAQEKAKEKQKVDENGKERLV